MTFAARLMGAAILLPGFVRDLQRRPTATGKPRRLTAFGRSEYSQLPAASSTGTVMSFIVRANFSRAATVFIALLASPPFAGAREFRIADTQSEDYPTVQALMFIARLVEGRTGGRHHIRVFHSRQLGEEKETIEQTRVGAIDLNRTNVAPIGSLIPAANVLAM